MFKVPQTEQLVEEADVEKVLINLLVLKLAPGQSGVVTVRNMAVCSLTMVY